MNTRLISDAMYPGLAVGGYFDPEGGDLIVTFPSQRVGTFFNVDDRVEFQLQTMRQYIGAEEGEPILRMPVFSTEFAIMLIKEINGWPESF